MRVEITHSAAGAAEEIKSVQVQLIAHNVIRVLVGVKSAFPEVSYGKERGTLVIGFIRYSEALEEYKNTYLRLIPTTETEQDILSGKIFDNSELTTVDLLCLSASAQKETPVLPLYLKTEEQRG